MDIDERDATVDRLLELVRIAAHRERKAAEDQQYWVGQVRLYGASWQLIGKQLGISRQAAWERFSGHERDSELGTEDGD